MRNEEAAQCPPLYHKVLQALPCDVPSQHIWYDYGLQLKKQKKSKKSKKSKKEKHGNLKFPMLE